ncbi:MAG: tetratricopeptide repeat protein [Planctomycetota bacterium]|jgi:tetratricopeptide (TPR) repeat protein
MTENNENEEASRVENKDADKAGNTIVKVKDEANQPSSAPIEPDGNQQGNKGGLKSLTGWLAWAQTNYGRITVIVVPCIASIFAFWRGFGQWWFGFDLPDWIPLVLTASLLVIWVVAFCGYYREAHPERIPVRREKEQKEHFKLRCLSLNVFVMIAIPVLLLGVVGGHIAMKWRLKEKIVILVEPFEEIGAVQADDASGNELEGIAEIIKDELDQAIREQEKRMDVRVVLGKRHEQELSEEALLEERALEYRADMVVSGWYVRRGDDQNTEFLVSPKFQVVRVPKSLPAVFRARGSAYPEASIFSGKEVESLSTSFTLKKLLKFAKQLTYEPTLVLGAGAYAAGDWKTAQQLFGHALCMVEDPNSPESGSKTNAESSENESATKKEHAEREPASKVGRPKEESETNVKSSEKKPGTEVEEAEKDPEGKAAGESRDRNEHIEGDKALLHLYIGHCLMNRDRYEDAILQYDDAIEAGKEINIRDMRYGEILASAYQARGIAYRQVNAFQLARQDFETAGGYLPTSLGLRPLRAEEARFLSGYRERLVDGAERYYRRGEKYLIQEEHKHAQAYLEMSVKFYRRLMKGMPTTVQEDYTLGLAESLVRLGETHNRLAKPDLRDDENYKQAIEYLNEAISLTTTRFGDQKDRNMLEIWADGLRHLGEAHRAQDQNDVVIKALRYHADAKSIWLGFEKLENTEKQKTKIVKKVAGEETRIGNVYRRLDDLKPDPKHLQEAICAYKEAIEKLGGKEYNQIFNADSNEVKENLICETTKKIMIHHLAHSVCNLAETHIKQSLDESDKEDPNEAKMKHDMRIACGLLEYGTRCYEVAVEKLHVEKDPNWIDCIWNDERNVDLRDDLAWSLTLYGYALIRNPPADPNDPNHHKKVYGILKKAKKRFSKFREVNVNQGHRVFNLFALTVPQVVLEQHPVPQQTFRDACNLLRDLTRKEKKVWYMDYVCDILDELINRKFQVSEKPKEDEVNFEYLKKWLEASIVRDGRRALDKIIEDMEKRLKTAGEVDT